MPGIATLRSARYRVGQARFSSADTGRGGAGLGNELLFDLGDRAGGDGDPEGEHAGAVLLHVVVQLLERRGLIRAAAVTGDVDGDRDLRRDRHGVELWVDVEDVVIVGRAVRLVGVILHPRRVSGGAGEEL